MTKPTRVKLIKDRYEQGVKRKQNWLTIYQLIGEYVMTRKQNFLSTSMPGEFLTEQLFSNTAPEANRTMASALLGNLWPNGARSFLLERPNNISDSKVNNKYFSEVSMILAEHMDLPEAGLATALDEYMLDNGSFGISGIGIEETDDFFIPIRYRAMNVKNFVVEENQYGDLDTKFVDEEITIDQAVKAYGYENLSKKVREQFDNGRLLETVRILRLMEPRREGRFGFGNKSLPIASIHIEYDTNKIIKESGFREDRIIIGRFSKALGEIYGRSPAMFAMPAILRLNLIWELIMRIEEKRGNPPLYLLDNGALGSRILDSSPGGLSIFNVTGLGESAPVGQLFDIGDTKGMFQLIEQLMNDVSKAFFIDRLFDLNNDTRMTLGEAQIRDRFRGEGLSSVFKRQEAEMFSPLIKTSFNILFDKGLLGVIKGSEKEQEILEAGLVPLYIPDDVANAIERGQRVYDIKYVSPAARILKIEEAQGLTQMLDTTLGLSQALPSIIDGLNVDEIRNKYADLFGVDKITLNDSETIKAIREAKSQQAQQTASVDQAEKVASATMKNAQAQSMLIGAANGRPKG